MRPQSAADAAPAGADSGDSGVGAAELLYDPRGIDHACGDFTTQAQAFYEASGGPAVDRHRLDGDGDGVGLVRLCRKNRG